MSSISAPVGSLASLCHVRIWGEGGNLQPEGDPYQNPSLLPPCPETASRTEKFVVYKPLVYKLLFVCTGTATANW